ncbi:MAG TPA: hypothetical protein VKF37_10405 [Chloroflexota bacterium]|nr:hypothetical protein [Chloroflexota bacterium]
MTALLIDGLVGLTLEILLLARLTVAVVERVDRRTVMNVVPCVARAAAP